MITVASSLAIVLGVFLLAAWFMRRAAPNGSLSLPGDVFEVLGRAPLGQRQQVHLLRCGSKLLLVSVTSSGAETLTEVADPVEVDRLAGLCRQAHPQSATAAFRQVFQQFAPRRPQSESPSDLARGDHGGDRRFAGRVRSGLGEGPETLHA
jgi:flagellar biosynthetic protein FliO